MKLNERELAAVLAGLWILQLELERRSLTYLLVRPPWIAILTDDYMLEPLTSDEIDELCERLNTGG